MKKIVITEKQLEDIVENITKDIKNLPESEVDEGLLDTIKQPFQKLKYGIKGIRGGYGWDYMSYMVELKNILKDLKNIDRPNEKIMLKLDELKTKISSSSMKPDLKLDMIKAITQSIRYFRLYQRNIDKIFISANLTLKTGGSLKTNMTTPTPTSTPTATP
jgi:hypothetical protein